MEIEPRMYIEYKQDRVKLAAIKEKNLEPYWYL